MAKTEQMSVADIFRQVPALFSVNPMVGPQVEHFWKAQEEMLKEAETFSEHWFARRHAATKTALDAAKEVTANGGSNPALALEAMFDWQRHSMERIAEDFKEWADMCARCAGHVARAEIEGDSEAIEETAKRAAAATKTKHATPV